LEGTVRQIQVEENQSVREGDVIAYLDDTRLQIERTQLQGSIQQNQLQLDQLQAQIRLIDNQILAESRSIEGAVSAAEADIRRNQREYEERQLTSQADFAEAEAALELAIDERERYRQLVQSGAVSDLQLQEKETAARTAEARLERTRALLNPTNASVDIAQKEVSQQIARGEVAIANLQKEREALLQRQSEIQTQLIREQTQLKQTERDLANSVIRATSNGVIFRLNLSNSNQVVRSGDSIAQIAPNEAPLTIRAMVANQDIDRVNVGQTAKVRVNACPYPDYGILEGVVTSVAPDAGSGGEASGTGNNSQGEGSNRSFEVFIQPDQMVLTRGNRECRIQPGMEATTSIISREETFLQSLLRRARLFTDL
jgi:HlyD family secretion protein